MSRRRYGSNDGEAEVDMTPMLDVVFIMLIFFIVTTSFVREAGIDVQRPSAASTQTKEGTPILIAIADNGGVWIDQRQVDIRALRAHIERLRAENPEAIVVIQADEISQTGLLVQVMDQARLAGIETISIAATEPR